VIEVLSIRGPEPKLQDLFLTWLCHTVSRQSDETTRKVVNVSSISGLYGADTLFSYTAAKSALFGMTRSLARDWERYRVTLN
jgi:NAD(P)-dependent dehydrogenase (short-subunit alcohol dehydrogenase family)